MNQRILITPRFSVEHRSYPSSTGGTFERDVVVHPGAVVILPLLADGRVVLIRNFRHTVGQELWELPAGTREPDESPLETARRELEEETGYVANTWQPLAEFYTSPGVLTERMYAFLAMDLSPTKQRLEVDERIVPHALAEKDVRRMLLAGEIQDGKSLAVLGLYLLRGSSRDACEPKDTV